MSEGQAPESESAAPAPSLAPSSASSVESEPTASSLIDTVGEGASEAVQSTRRDREGEGPQGDLDQLLDTPPRGDHHLGRFAGYRDGAGIRRGIAVFFVLCGIAMVVAFLAHQDELKTRYAQEEYERLHPWQLPEGTDTRGRSRDFHWSSGTMRIPLSREAPGIERVILPDKVIWLADDADHAQIKVEVVDGKTQGIKILSGDVQHRERLPDETF